MASLTLANQTDSSKTASQQPECLCKNLGRDHVGSPEVWSRAPSKLSETVSESSMRSEKMTRLQLEACPSGKFADNILVQSLAMSA